MKALLLLLLTSPLLAQVQIARGVQVGGTTNISGISALVGPVTGSGAGTVTTVITPTGVSAGCYTLGAQAVCFNAAGQATTVGAPFGLSISCTASATSPLEVGATTSNPNTCTFNYSNGSPASATLTDGTNNVTLGSPYTSGSLAFSYCTTGQGSTSFTFTGNAVAVTSGLTASSSRGLACSYRTWAGGSVGVATSASTSGTNAVLNSGYGTLSSAGLGNTFVGQTFTLSLSGQYPSLILTGGCGHTFTVNGLPTTFSCTPYTITNQYGASETTGIYTGPATLTGSAVIVQVTAL